MRKYIKTMFLLTACVVIVIIATWLVPKLLWRTTAGDDPFCYKQGRMEFTVQRSEDGSVLASAVSLGSFPREAELFNVPMVYCMDDLPFDQLDGSSESHLVEESGHSYIDDIMESEKTAPGFLLHIQNDHLLGYAAVHSYKIRRAGRRWRAQMRIWEHDLTEPLAMERVAVSRGEVLNLGKSEHRYYLLHNPDYAPNPDDIGVQDLTAHAVDWKLFYLFRLE